jgi:hypothetical protein
MIRSKLGTAQNTHQRASYTNVPCSKRLAVALNCWGLNPVDRHATSWHDSVQDLRQQGCGMNDMAPMNLTAALRFTILTSKTIRSLTSVVDTGTMAASLEIHHQAGIVGARLGIIYLRRHR